jgi:hypothetical protein
MKIIVLFITSNLITLRKARNVLPWFGFSNSDYDEEVVVPVINEPHERKNVVFYIELKGPVKMKPQINLIQRKCLVICRHLPVV